MQNSYLFSRKTWLGFLVSLLFSALLLGSAAAKPPPKDHRAKIEERMKQVIERVLKEEVGLNDAKAKQVQELFAKQNAEQAKLRQELQNAEQALSTLVEGDNADEKAYANALKELRAKQNAVHTARNKHQDQMGKLLTSKQHAKLLHSLQKLERTLRKGMRRHRAPPR